MYTGSISYNQKLKLATVLALFLPLSLALPTTSNNINHHHHHHAERDINKFRVMTSRSGSPIHFLPLNAADTSFWLGGKTSSFCPPEVGSSCPKGDVTVLVGDGSALVNVIVPGGQLVYVDNKGALRFTSLHSTDMGPGASRGPFVYTPPEPNGNGLGSWTYTGQGADGFMACPTDDNMWQVFADLDTATVPGGDVKQCLGCSALTSDPKLNGTAAWEYV